MSRIATRPGDKPKSLDYQTAELLRLLHPTMIDPEASQVWALLKTYDRFNLPSMPLLPEESALVELVLMDR